MKQKIYISGRRIDLDKSAPEVEADLQSALDLYFQGYTPHYNEDGKKKCTITIDRSETYYMTGNIIKAEDCSLLTGLEVAMWGIDPIGTYREKWAKQGVVVAPITPATFPYAGAYYVGYEEFVDIYKKMIEDAVGVLVKKLEVLPTNTTLTLKIQFK